MTYRATVVPRDNVPDIADILQIHWIEANKWSDGRFEASDFVQKCIEGLSTAIIVFDDETDDIVAACCVTTAEFPKSKDFLIEYIGGDGLKDWGDMLMQYLNDLAGSTNHDAIIYTGREGWLRRMGFKPLGVFAERQIVKGKISTSS